MNNCTLCHSSEIVNYPKSGSKYQLNKCQGCGLIYEPKQKTKKNIYNQNYFLSQELKGGYYNYFEESTVNKLTFRHRLIQLSKRIGHKRAKLIDVGCALGDFIEVAKSLRWENISGVDVSEFAVKECRKKGLKVSHVRNSKSLVKLFGSNSFDVMTLQDVIEHYENPVLELQQVAKILKPGGLLLLTTPNSASVTAALMGKHWYHYKKGEHLFYFNPANIKKILVEQGFGAITVKHTPSWVTIKYLVDRLSYYLPKKYITILRKLTSNPFSHIVFPVYTGEMEIWATKSK